MVAGKHNYCHSHVLTFGYGSSLFSDKNAGNGKTITVSGITLGGADAGNYTYNTSAGWRTKASSAYTVGASFSYPGVFQGWDLDVPLSFSNVFSGSTPMAGSISGVAGDRRLSVGSTFKYLGNLESV